MPQGPEDKQRPTDVIGNAVHVMQIATGRLLTQVRAEPPGALVRCKSLFLEMTYLAV